GDPRDPQLRLRRRAVPPGLLGRKSGRGFYTYQAPGSSAVVPDELTPAADPSTPDAPAVIAVVGDAALAELFRTAGYPTTVVTGSELADLGEADSFGETDLIVEAAGKAAGPTRARLARGGERGAP